MVVVVEDDQAAEAEVPREAARLGGDALLEAAVAADDEGVRVDDGEALAVELGGEVRLRDRHADRVRDALPERPRRNLDRRVEHVLGVARGDAVELPEALELREREVVARHLHAVWVHRSVDRLPADKQPRASHARAACYRGARMRARSRARSGRATA